MWLAGDPAAAAILGSAGWEPGHHRQRLHMTSVLFEPALDGARLIRRFYLTMGDSDLA
jgi:hypothetical protein